MKSYQWNAICIWDGVTPNISLHLANIQHISIPKVGFANCAGEVRNKGIKEATTEWIAFVDDDDQVTQDYMYRLQQEIVTHPKAEVIVFRMLQNGHILPSTSAIHCNDVGISFAMKRSLCSTFYFKPSKTEDFDLLSRLQRANIPIHISSYVTYLVRPNH